MQNGAIYGVSNGAHQLAGRGDVVASPPSNQMQTHPMTMNGEFCNMIARKKWTIMGMTLFNRLLMDH